MIADPPLLDFNIPRHIETDRRLRDEPIIWLGSVRPDGRPHFVPLWFLWDGATVLMFSAPTAQKVRNIRHNPHVTLALEARDFGADIVRIEGVATLLSTDTAAMTMPAYVEKYLPLMKRMNEQMTPEALAGWFSQPIRVTPTRILNYLGKGSLSADGIASTDAPTGPSSPNTSTGTTTK